MTPDAAASQARPGRSAATPRPLVADVGAALAGLGFGAVLASVIENETHGTLSAPGGLLSALGRLAAFTGTYLLLILVVLAARLPWLERSVGQDKLIRWHSRVAPWAVGLICLHVVATIIGYAQAGRTSVVHETWLQIDTYRDVLAATVGFGLLLLASVTSYRAIRRRMRYETWWAVHLYLYLAIALSFAHALFTGLSFVGHPLTRALWIVVWLATAGMVIAFRIGQPAWLSLRHQLRVTEVREEAPDVISVVCQGRHLEKLAVSGGQFFQWRFLTRGLWWHARPFSLSALPQPPFLRVTIRASGETGRAIAAVRPGTRVVIEGPYGTFTQQTRTGDAVLLVGAGVGITPLRALLEDLPAGADVAVVIRASSEEGLLHRKEIDALVRRRGGKLHELLGRREEVRLDGGRLAELVPDITGRDLYVCGPDGFAAEVAGAAAELGVAQGKIHAETFGF